MIYKDYFTPSPMVEDDHLEHHGVLGMKWGVRRFQNADGTLTAKGKARQSNRVDTLKRKANEARVGSKEWANIAKTASSKRFLGNPSPKELATQWSKDELKRAERLDKKIQKITTSTAKLSSQKKTLIKEANDWVKEAQFMDNKRWLGNPSSREIALDIANSMYKQAANIDRKIDRINR